MTPRQLFNKLNRRYFNNRIPKPGAVAFVEKRRLPRAHAQTHFCHHGSRVKEVAYIHIRDTCLCEKCVTRYMLHEMVHLKNPHNNGHGKWFEDEMLKLVRRGAYRRIW